MRRVLRVPLVEREERRKGNGFRRIEGGGELKSLLVLLEGEVATGRMEEGPKRTVDGDEVETLPGKMSIWTTEGGNISLSTEEASEEGKEGSLWR